MPDLRLSLRAFLFHPFTTGYVSERLFHFAYSRILADLTTLLIGDLLGGSHFFKSRTLVGSSGVLHVCRCI